MRPLIFRYALVGAVLGLVPLGGSLLLLVLEGTMFYHICAKRRVPVLHEGFAFVLTVFAASGLFKFVAEFLHTIPVIGQIANAIVAFAVVYGIGLVVDNYCQHS